MWACVCVHCECVRRVVWHIVLHLSTFTHLTLALICGPIYISTQHILVATPRALVLAPTRELAEQVYTQVEEVIKDITVDDENSTEGGRRKLRSVVVFGGVDDKWQVCNSVHVVNVNVYECECV
jgi:superfamily II DNA/RNA helicase